MRRLFKYLKAAFWVREKIPLLGYVPLNVLTLLAFAVLGFGHPAFWLIGLAGEMGFLWIMAGSPRFRKWVDAVDHAAIQKQDLGERETLLALLTPPNRNRFDSLEAKYETIRSNYEKSHTGESLYENNLANLKSLKRVHLRLLAASQKLEVQDQGENLRSIRIRIDEIETELASPGLTEASRESRTQTRNLLEKRIDVLENRNRSLDEIRSDLEQIETQFQLSLDSTALDTSLTEEKLDLDLARNMITTPGYTAFLADESEPDPLVEWESE